MSHLFDSVSANGESRRQLVTIEHFGTAVRGRVQLSRYEINGRLAVRFIEDDGSAHGVPYSWLSTNRPEVALGDGEFLFKTYSENEGLIEEFVRVGIVEVIRQCESIGLPVCSLTADERVKTACAGG